MFFTKGAFNNEWLYSAILLLVLASRKELSYNIDKIEKTEFNNKDMNININTSEDNNGNKNGNNSNNNESTMTLINQIIMNIFIGHHNDNNDFTYHSEVGCYCVKFLGNDVFILIDDILPMLTKDLWTENNKGSAAIYDKNFTVLWVSLIEKAYAKLYGDYSALERGYVHHALADLTGIYWWVCFFVLFFIVFWGFLLFIFFL